MEILLKDGTTFELSAEDYIFYQNLYPGADIEQELRSMAGWCYSNPSKRKTKRGIKKFINSWLNRSIAHEKGRRNTKQSAGDRIRAEAEREFGTDEAQARTSMEVMAISR